MKLLKHIKKIAPIDNELDIQHLLQIMKKRDARIGIYQENLLLFHTVPELHDFLKNSIRLYRQSYKQSHEGSSPIVVQPQIKVYRSERKSEEPQNGISRNGLTQEDKNALNMFSFRNDNKQNSLSKKGYDYGLSDW